MPGASMTLSLIRNSVRSTATTTDPLPEAAPPPGWKPTNPIVPARLLQHRHVPGVPPSQARRRGPARCGPGHPQPVAGELQHARQVF
jgi:hypothetical protein